MKVLGVVTARGGSKRLPGKNIADLGGIPLIVWSIRVGLTTCDKVVTTTDHEEIAEVALRNGSDLVERPPYLSQGLPGMHLQSVLHALDAMEQRYGEYDAVLLLQPTCPFRLAVDVEVCKLMLDSEAVESVISMKKVPVVDTFFKQGALGRLRPAANEQDHIWTPNGAIYLTRSNVLRMDPPRGGWYGPGTYGYYDMPADRCIDIDTHADMDAARAFLSQYEQPPFRPQEASSL